MIENDSLLNTSNQKNILLKCEVKIIHVCVNNYLIVYTLNFVFKSLDFIDTQNIYNGI